ncbi:Hypothetical predicted protein [Cloeon dipterum]|nr:Hypothetical predicted protein [Cloeon dipterum]
MAGSAVVTGRQLAWPPEAHMLPSKERPSSCPDSPLAPAPRPSRARGLLERRGSSASLTIDLHPAQSSAPPPQSALLASASCRLTRARLRGCLSDVRALHAQFWEIPSNIPERPGLAGSGPKNRYRCVLPNEHSRVRLLHEPDPLAAYINANYVRGNAGEARAFVATQGPLPHTLHDFWTMVLQETASALVMITKLREKGRTKCEKYLPDHQQPRMEVADIQVRWLGSEQHRGFLVTQLEVRRGSQRLRLPHFWFTDWPDHKAPEDAAPLVAMAELAEESRMRGRGPAVVHCSAGIGRTGCFIAVALGMQQLRVEHAVDVLAIVCAMRQDRGGMVQTGEQYEFIHRALALFERSLPPEDA